jgi:hypothetical protein
LLEVVEIREKMKQGRTEPYLCIANDGNKYIVKNNKTLGRGLLCEYICAFIGKNFKLPIPDFELINISPNLIKNNNLESHFNDYPAFASKYIELAQEVNLTILKKINPELLKSIFIFDYWIKNEDRTLGDNGLGNPNLLFNNTLYVLDHNLAFDNEYSFEEVSKTHVARKYWHPQQVDFFDFNDDRDKYQKRFEKSLINLDECIQQLPHSWFSCSQVENDFIANLKNKLYSYKTSEFWEVLK